MTYLTTNSTLLFSRISSTLNSNSEMGCGILTDESKVYLDANLIEGLSIADTKNSIGINISDAKDAVLTNNIIYLIGEDEATGIKTDLSAPLIINNTLKITASKRANGIVFAGGSPKIINNFIVTENATDGQISLLCKKDLVEAVIKNNLLTTFPQEGINSILLDCDGNYLSANEFIEDATFQMQGADISDNKYYSGEINGLIDSNFNLIAPIGFDAGINVDVLTDYNGKVRYENLIDIGAIEK